MVKHVRNVLVGPWCRMNAPNETFTYEQVVNIARSLKNPRNRALFALEFLTGARVCEIVGRLLKRQLVFRKIEGREFLVIERVYTEKKGSGKGSSRRKKKPTDRTLTIYIARDAELVEIVEEFTATKQADDILFPITRQRAWQILSAIIAQNKKRSTDNMFLNGNHFMRHSRNTDLIIRYNFTDADLRKWNNWSSTEPAKDYEHLRTIDLARRMINA